ncbi:MAG: excisionase family DNA-binding protein [Propionibacteriaceae bacterium]|jgi:excisionase family DNA binding protein|nr:excisionase family DNA-binding protein [Propionibacteriaceae bacterium]
MTLTVTPRHTSDLADVADSLTTNPVVALVTPEGKTVGLPAELLEVLSTATQALADGQTVVLGTQDSYLTTQEAADYLGVSRPTLIRFLDLAQISYERPNSHRRIKLADLVRFREDRARRRATLDELLHSSVELEQYDNGEFARTR